jgi:hypothetical protein
MIADEVARSTVRAMPEISRFFGIVIAMHHGDHAPPHFHARYGDSRAVISIEGSTILAGSLPPRAIGLVVEWAAIHRNELARDWERAAKSEPLDAIEPLR